MCTTLLSRMNGVLLLLLVLFTGAASLIGCSREQPTDSRPDFYPFTFEATGEEFLLSALDEVLFIADWAASQGGSGPILLRPGERRVLAKSAADTVYIYGQGTSGGYGAVVTERRTYPKGLLLITVRKTHGAEDGCMVTETKRYISYQNFLDDQPQQSSLTEVVGLSTDTIRTRVLRNNVLETFTFRLPVITRVINPLDGSIRETRRYGADSTVISEVKDGTGALIRLTRSRGLEDGSLVSRTEYADSTWRSVRTLGLTDGTILREITTGP